jgi:hypothetical protein
LALARSLLYLRSKGDTTMKKTVLKKKLTLDRETISPLTAETLENVNGGGTPSIIASFIITMLSCGFFCNPQKAR